MDQDRSSEKGTFDADWGTKVVQHEPVDRGKHVPQLKLDSDDRITMLKPKPLRITELRQGYYPMNNGVALIVNNHYFSDPGWERKGAERDEYNLKETFLFLGYCPLIFKNLSKKEIIYIFSHLDDFLTDT